MFIVIKLIVNVVEVKALVAFVLLKRGRKQFRILLATCFRDLLTSQTPNGGVIQTDPFAAILASDVDCIVTTARIFPVVVDDPNKSILWKIAMYG